MSPPSPGAVRLAVRLARGVARLYPATLSRERQEIRAFLTDAAEAAWATHGWRGLAALVLSTTRDVVVTRARAPGLPVTRAHRAGQFSPSPFNRDWRIPMDRLIQDLRVGLRRLRQTPGFTGAAVLSLALGIGATTAVFTVVDQSMLRPLPYPDADRMMALHEVNGRGEAMSVAWQDFQDWRSAVTAFDELGLYRSMAVNLTGHDRAERLSGSLVSSAVFQTTGIPPLQGRTFGAAEDLPTATRVAVISERLWRSRFAARADLVGSDVTLNNQSFTIVGVMPAAMRFPSRQTDVWLPLGLFIETFPSSRGNHPNLWAVGRLKHGVALTEARAQMSTIAGRLADQYPDSNTKVGVNVTPYVTQVFENIRPAFMLLLGAVTLVILITCANLGSLMLARGEARQKELAVRSALGAGRGRLVQQQLVEALLIAAVGGGLGVLLAIWAVGAFIASGPTSVPRIDLVHVDLRVLGFAAATSIVCGVLFGLAPALRASVVNLSAALMSGDRHTGGGTTRIRSVLVSGEIAVAMMLLVGAGLLIKSFARVMETDLGFSPSRVVTMRLTLPPAKYSSLDAWVGFHHDLIDRLAATPGVEAAGINTAIPLEGGGSESFVIKEGDPLPTPEHPPSRSSFHVASAGFFQTLGIQLVRGRLFDERDRTGGPLVAIVDDTLVEKLFGGADPIGGRIAFEETPAERPADRQPRWREVIGVVHHVTHYGLTGEPPFLQVFTPYTQLPTYLQTRRPGMALFVRASGSGEVAASTARQAVSAVDPDIPVYNVQAMTEYVREASEQPRLSMALLSTFATLALVMAVIGVYGVLSYAVARRTREIGVRRALGAQHIDVLRLVGRQAIVLIGAGILVGTAAAYAASRFVQTMLFEVSPTDRSTFAIVIAVLTVAAGAACFIPARRASTVDPIVALRGE